MKKKWLMLAGAMVLSSLISLNQPAHAEEKINVMTTFYPVYEFTKQIVGTQGKVELLIPAGSEAHDYEPSAKDMSKIEKADVFVYHNENLEGWVAKAKKSWHGDTKVIKGTKGMLLLPGSEDHDHTHEAGHGHSHEYDPHTWVAPPLAKQEVASITKQLSKLYPTKKTVFEKNAAAFSQQLDQLDQQYQTALKDAKQKEFVTQHAAFHYLAVEYGLKEIPIAGLSPDQEPSPAQLAKLKKVVEQKGIKTIYFEKNASSKLAQTLADEAGVKLAVLNPLESLTKTQLKQGKNYLTVMAENLKALTKTTDQPGKAVETNQTQPEKTVANGYFATKDVKARKLSDWQGKWRSVYPLLENGTLDQVFAYKAKLAPTKSAAEYKAYYQTGYQTDVDQIEITKDQMTFVVDGKKYTSKYRAAGKKILQYEKGNRGVRYLFEATEKMPYKYVQFSDHGIAPEKAAHFHLFFGQTSQAELLKEMDHWPTYYPEKLSDHAIAQEMLAH